MEPMVATPHGGDRSKAETFHLDDRDPGKTRDKIGAFAGVSGEIARRFKAPDDPTRLALARISRQAGAETGKECLDWLPGSNGLLAADLAPFRTDAPRPI
jgi:hypothetical protein